MFRKLTVNVERFPIAGTFRISRGAKTEAVVISCEIKQNDFVGRGECVPYGRYGETIESVIAQIEDMREDVQNGINQNILNKKYLAGAARNAIDCALWDLDAKVSGISVASRLNLHFPRELITTQTLSLGAPEEMAQEASRHASRPLLKFKVGSDDGDIERIKAVSQAAPNSRLILDANEGWSEQNIEENVAAAAAYGVVLIEQPLPAGKDAILSEIPHLVPFCADESIHTRASLAELRQRYDAVNIKLDKTGGLTEGFALMNEAQSLGFKIMIGCMVGTSLSMAPAVLLAQSADYVDLDGPLLLARDRVPSLRYDGASVYPPQPELWG